MSPAAQARFWRRARLTFRWCRIAGWLGILALVCALLYVNVIGLPGFLKDPILAELRAHGVDLSFQRLRLVWYQGIVADHVTLGQPAAENRLHLSARELVIRPDFAALLHRTFRLHGVALREGALSLELAATNASVRTLVVRQLHAQVDFRPDDHWQLSQLAGQCLGVDFRLSGSLTNGSALLSRKPRAGPSAREQAAFWNRILAQAEQVEFIGSASVKGSFSGDGARTEVSSGRIELEAGHFRSPWATGHNLHGLLTVAPESNSLARAEVIISSETTHTRWGRARSLELHGSAEIPFAAPRFQQPRLRLESEFPATAWGSADRLTLTATGRSTTAPGWAEDSELSIRGQKLQTPWGGAAECELEATLRATPDNPLETRGAYKLRCHQTRSEWFEAGTAQLTAQTLQSSTNLWPRSLQAIVTLDDPACPRTNLAAGLFAGGAAQPGAGTATPPVAAKTARLEANLSLPPLAEFVAGGTNVSWRARLERLHGDGRMELEAIATPEVELEGLSLVCRWQPPVLSLETARLSFYGGRMTVTGQMDLASRRVTADIASEAPLDRLLPLVSTNWSTWNTVVQWEQPLRAHVHGAFVLPGERGPDWRPRLLRSLELAGDMDSGPGVLHSVPFLSTTVAFDLTNRLWQVRNLEVVRPEGALRLNLALDSATGLIEASFRSTIDPMALRPLFTSAEAGAALDYFQFTLPPVLEGTARIPWNDWAGAGGRARVALTNMVFRGQPMKSVVTEITYTNRVIDCLQPEVQRAEGAARAELVRIDLRNETINLTNATGTIEVSALAHSIGPHIVKTLQPYQFTRPPAVRFQGTVGIHGGSGLDDARFEVTGGPFQWQKFKLTSVAARLHWRGDTLAITNFEGVLKGGDVKGHGWFDFSGPQKMDFRFGIAATNVSAEPLLADLFPETTNRLEGFLGGRLTITNANAASFQSWFGYGNVSLRDGLIWDVPLFSHLSPILNSVVPGIASSRARQATASFAITNSVIATRDLEIHASAMRMRLDGTVDFEGRTQGRVEAGLFRDTPGLGWMISLVLTPVTKIFVYKVGGTLGHPKLEPLYIPKFLLVPFHPLRALKELFSDEKYQEKPEEKKSGPRE